MTTPTNTAEDILLIWGAGKHANNHGDHFKEMGHPYTSIDPAHPKNAQNGEILQWRWTIHDYLKASQRVAKWALISSPDREHIKDLEACVKAGIRCILIEKPAALNREELKRFQELQAEAAKNGQIIMTCLPRFTDVRYRQLIDMMPELKEEFWNIMHIRHGLNAQQLNPQWSAGSDHIAHEMTTMLQVMWFVGWLDDIKITSHADSAEKYTCSGEIGNVNFNLWTDKKAPQVEEKISLGFQHGRVLFNTREKTLIITPHTGKERIITMVDGDAKARLMAISNNFVKMALGESGTEVYLPQNMLNASAHFPATLFPVQ